MLSVPVFTAGIDVGSSAIKTAVVRTDADGASTVLHLRSHRIRRRELRKVIEDAWTAALDEHEAPRRRHRLRRERPARATSSTSGAAISTA